MLNIHKNIEKQLNHYYTTKNVPNIIFNGSSGSGKSTILNNFISLIYDHDKTKIREMCMFVNCAHGKGIKFVRDELKFFAKTNINTHGGKFKSIVLTNGDKLTTDAQSALRRCIELFTFNTRFFIIVEDKYKLLTPILSRFCEIYVPEPQYRGNSINLYQYNLNKMFNQSISKKTRLNSLEQRLINVMKDDKTSTSPVKISEFVSELYDDGYCALDIQKLLENNLHNEELSDLTRYKLLMMFEKMKKEHRDEKTLMMCMIYYIFIFLPTNVDVDIHL